MLIQAIASIPVRELRRPVASLAQERDAITCAPDILFLGF
jgi:toxin CcdB